MIAQCPLVIWTMRLQRGEIMNLPLLLLALTSSAMPDLSNIPIVVEDDPPKSIFFYDKGWFSDARYPLKFFGGVWHWQSNGQWVVLNAPFVGMWNSSFRIILDRNGKIFLNSNDNKSQAEIRWRDGEWQWNSNDNEWTSISADRFESE